MGFAAYNGVHRGIGAVPKPLRIRGLLARLYLVLFFGSDRGSCSGHRRVGPETKAAVVEILTYDQQNNLLKSGPDFFVLPDGALLINYHAISGGSSIPLCEFKGEFFGLGAVQNSIRYGHRVQSESCILRCHLYEMPNLQRRKCRKRTLLQSVWDCVRLSELRRFERTRRRLLQPVRNSPKRRTIGPIRHS